MFSTFYNMDIIELNIFFSVSVNFAINLSEIIISYFAFSSGTPVFNIFFSGLAEEQEVSSFYLLSSGSKSSD